MGEDKYCGWRETFGERATRHLCKVLIPFTPHRSRFGRLLRTRGKTRLGLFPWLCSGVDRARQVFEAFDPETQVLALGTSHIEFGIRPDAAARLRFWNAGFPSCDWRMTYFVYAHLRERWPKRGGQCVAVGEDFWLPVLQAEYSVAFWVAVALHCLAGMPYRTRLGMGRHERLVRHILDTLPRRANVVQGFRDNQSEEQLVDLPVRVSRHIRFLRYAPEEVCWFNRLRESVEADGRALVRVRPPLRADYLAELERQCRPQGLEAWKLMDAVLPGKALDYTALAIPEALWHDADHLGARGAEVFTKRLEEALLREYPGLGG